ncbi:MAG: trypsin-like peptidase domain-containing protein [bacterium]|nr:trypsin-like peptidase domain-containing protein [bacterium]
MTNQNNNTPISIVVGLLSGIIAASVVCATVIGSIYFNPGLISQWLDANQDVESALALNDDLNLTSDNKNIITQEDMVIQSVENVQPAVVSIAISKDVPIIEQYYEEDPFGGLFGPGSGFQIPQYRENGTEKQEVGGGSGFLVSADGLIVTNKHVIDDPQAEYAVTLMDGTQYTASVVARDPLNDIATIKIEGNDFPFLSFGDSDQIKSGQTVIAIGNALSEFDNSVSVGVVSGLARSIVAGDGFGSSELLDDVIQTDAAINPGNSGGPLLNLDGEVIGVNVAVAFGSENIGFALPANTIKNVVNSIKETGSISRPYLGVRFIAITPELVEANNMTIDYGVLVLRGETPTDLAVMPGSPADKAGIVENDIITEVDNQKINPENRLEKIIQKKQVGDNVSLKILHDGEEKEIKVTLEELKDN